MATVDILPATLDHAAQLAPFLRAGDLAECLASGCVDGFSALADSVAHSSEAWSVFFDGEIAALVGVVPFDNGTTLVWALTGRAVDRARLTFVRVSRRLLAQLLRKHAVLANLVDARYQGAIDWLECLGFCVSQPTPHPTTGMPFRVASIRRS